MGSYRFLPLPILLLIAIGQGLPSAARAQDFVERNFHFTATGPVEILNGWTCWFADCSFANCHMTTIRQPQLGRLSVHVGKTTIHGNGVCNGRPTSGLFITYTPRPGAQGTDEVDLRSIADNGGRHLLHITIDILGSR